ncbi:MAG: endolytic transglycosylase MltG, partial [Anaerolineae bacterium]
FLYPDTYRLPEEATADDLLERMLSTFDERVTPALENAAAQQGLSLYELVTLASIVEREAVLAEERAVIAGVYQNRLQAGWTLDACPTVQYAIGSPSEWWPPFRLEATDTPSPYNTYQNNGLPPGPICSPGLASVKAAAEPADTDYFFFLADCTKDDGSHLFAETEGEHYANYEHCGGQGP